MWKTIVSGTAPHPPERLVHADGAVEALEAVPGRFVLAYGNLQQGPWEWSTSADFRSFVDRRFGSRNDMLGFQMAFDVTGDPEFPEQEAFKGRVVSCQHPDHDTAEWPPKR